MKTIFLCSNGPLNYKRWRQGALFRSLQPSTSTIEVGMLERESECLWKRKRRKLRKIMVEKKELWKFEKFVKKMSDLGRIWMESEDEWERVSCRERKWGGRRRKSEERRVRNQGWDCQSGTIVLLDTGTRAKPLVATPSFFCCGTTRAPSSRLWPEVPVPNHWKNFHWVVWAAQGCPLIRGTHAKSLVPLPWFFYCGTTRAPSSRLWHGVPVPNLWKNFSWVVWVARGCPLARASSTKFPNFLALEFFSFFRLLFSLLFFLSLFDSLPSSCGDDLHPLRDVVYTQQDAFIP